MIDATKIILLAVETIVRRKTDAQDNLYRACGSFDLKLESEAGQLYGDSERTLGEIRNGYRRTIIETTKQLQELKSNLD